MCNNFSLSFFLDISSLFDYYLCQLVFSIDCGSLTAAFSFSRGKRRRGTKSRRMNTYEKSDLYTILVQINPLE